MEKINFKQIGAGSLGALVISAFSAFSPVSKTNVADFQNVIQNPINNVLVQPAKCESGKCNCTYNTILGEKIDGKWTQTFYGIVCKSGC